MAPNTDTEDGYTEVDASHLDNPEDVEIQVDPEDVEVHSDHGRVNERVVTSPPKRPYDAREHAKNLADPDAGSDNSSLSSLSYNDDRNLPVHNGDVTDSGELDTSDHGPPVNTSTTRKKGATSLYGRAVRLDDVGPRHPDDKTLYLADEDGTCKIRLYGAFGIPEIRRGDQVVVLHVESNEEDGGPAWEQTENTTLVVIAASRQPPGYHLERRSRLIEAEDWYENKDDVEATRLVKVTLEDEFSLETPRGQGDSPETVMYIDDPEDQLHGTWTTNGDERIRELLEKHLPERKTNQRTKNAIMCSLRDRTRVPEGEWEPGAPEDPELKWVVGVKNGVIDLRTGELHDHGPEWRIRKKLPVEYHPEEYDDLGDTVNEFFDQTMRGAEDVESVLYLIAHALCRCYPAEAIWALIGSGSNGKTVLLALFDALFGDTLGDFKISLLSGDNDFGGGSLIGSNIVVDDDATGVKLSHTSDLKKQSGGRGGSVNQKYENIDGEVYRNYGTFVLVANNPPVFGDKTDGMKRRMYPIIMPYKFTDDPSDGHKTARNKDELISDLTDSDELEALLVVAVQYAQKIYRNGSVEDGRTKKERKELYDHYSDSILRFWSECMTQESGARVQRRAVYETAVQWCEANGVDPWSAGGRNGFWSLSDECHAVSYNRDGVYIDGDRAVEHVTFSEKAMQHAPQWVRDEWEAEVDDDDPLGNRLDRTTPLQDLDGGYCTVEATVISIASANPAEGRGVKLTLEDNTTAVDAVTWDDEFDAVGLGDTVRLTRAVLSQHNGVPQLKSSAAMSVEVVDSGDASDVPGRNEFKDHDDDDDSDGDGLVPTAIDDERLQDLEDEREELVNVIESADEDGVTLRDARDTVEDRMDASAEDVEAAAKALKKSGTIYEVTEGRWRAT